MVTNCSQFEPHFLSGTFSKKHPALRADCSRALPCWVKGSCLFTLGPGSFSAHGPDRQSMRCRGQGRRANWLPHPEGIHLAHQYSVCVSAREQYTTQPQHVSTSPVTPPLMPTWYAINHSSWHTYAYIYQITRAGQKDYTIAHSGFGRLLFSETTASLQQPGLSSDALDIIIVSFFPRLFFFFGRML